MKLTRYFHAHESGVRLEDGTHSPWKKNVQIDIFPYSLAVEGHDGYETYMVIYEEIE